MPAALISFLKQAGNHLQQDALRWCDGRNWIVRLPLVLYFAYIGVRMAFEPGYWSILNNVNLPIHEGGHLVFGVFPWLIPALGGTILQHLAPIGAMIMFLRQRDYFAIALCWGWLATNLHYTGWYMADARALAIPLVSVGGGHAYHDWNYILSDLGLLAQCEGLAWCVSQMGNAAIVICLLSSAWLLWRMRFPVEVEESPDE